MFEDMTIEEIKDHIRCYENEISELKAELQRRLKT